MIKRLALDLQPPHGGMTLTAVGAQGSSVGIPVAIEAGGMGQAGKYPGRFPVFRHMAFGAIDRLMFARQGKSGLIMDKLRRRPPGVGVMTFGARFDRR